MDRCPACGLRRRRHRQYLCRTCWYLLPSATRRRLSECTDKATARQRLLELLRAVAAEVPLEAIEVAA